MDWSELIIKLLGSHGFDHIFIAPGARSTPLARAAMKQGNYVVHFDERSLAFAALGVSKTKQHKAIVIVTSGTAVGNLLPAVMEASLSLISLILLTADRPYELRETSANQTVDQVKVFSNFTRWHFDIPAPNRCIHSNWLVSTMAYAAFKAKDGPVHLNCMFREPLSTYMIEPPKLKSRYVFNGSEIHWHADWHEKGVFIISEEMDEESFELLIRLAQRLQWPIIVEILCVARSQYKHGYVIPYHEMQPELPLPYMIIQFGDRLISNGLVDFIKKTQEYIVVSDSPFRIDAHLAVTTRIVSHAKHVVKSWLEKVTQKENKQWLRSWQHFNVCSGYRLRKYFGRENKLSEPGIIRECFQHVKPVMFVGNSMPIRDANKFVECNHEKHEVQVFANRGVSGIDGNLATSMGLSYALKKACMCIVGDLAFLHDINSLHLLRHWHVCVVVINNNGGGIFNFVPNMVMHGAHNYANFAHLARQFDFGYDAVSNGYELRQCLTNTQGAHLIEIKTDRDQNWFLHKQLEKYVTQR
nr:2-succinyl-6-hydroxy-2,4-cyclohexadiene-1-carboxylate synthase [Cyanidioschyzonaceae sp. 2]